MNSLEILSPSGDPIIVAPPIYRKNSFEHVLCYQRRDTKHVEMVVTHLNGGRPEPPTLGIASYRTVNNPNMIPSEKITISMEEARLLRDFLNRPEVVEWLEEEA